MWASFVRLLDELAQAFREGGGIPQAAYDRGVREGMERLSRGYVENWLAQEWIPAMPDVRAKLEQGADVADVGCGRAGATIKLAELYPPSRFTGYDAFGPTIDEAKGRAHAAGVSGRVAFDQRDAARGLPSTYDVITTFDVVHDSPDPPGLLRSIRRGLKDEGIYVCVDANCSAKLEDNAGPLGSLYYGFSLLYCMTTSLAAGGAGLGTLGFHEENVRALCAEAGFGSVRRVPIQSPLHSLYEIRP
jgi:SAM-dependent methyltransferase